MSKDLSKARNIGIVAHIDAGENPLEDTPDDLTQSIDIVSRPAEEPSSGLSWVLGAIFALVSCPEYPTKHLYLSLRVLIALRFKSLGLAG